MYFGECQSTGLRTKSLSIFAVSKMHDYDERFKYKFYTTTTRNPLIAYHQDTDSQQNNEIFIRYLFSSPQPCYSRFSFILGWYIFTFFTLSARNFLHPNRAGNNFSATFPTTIAHNLCKFSLSLIQTGSIEILPNRIEQTADLQRAYIRRTHGTNFPPGEGGSRQTYPDPDHDRPVRVLVTQSKRARHTIVVQRLGCWRKAVSFFFGGENPPPPVFHPVRSISLTKTLNSDEHHSPI